VIKINEAHHSQLGQHGAQEEDNLDGHGGLVQDGWYEHHVPIMYSRQQSEGMGAIPISERQWRVAFRNVGTGRNWV
jgi:hypothetical protein